MAQKQNQSVTKVLHIPERKARFEESGLKPILSEIKPSEKNIGLFCSLDLSRILKYQFQY